MNNILALSQPCPSLVRAEATGNISRCNRKDFSFAAFADFRMPRAPSEALGLVSRSPPKNSHATARRPPASHDACCKQERFLRHAHPALHATRDGSLSRSRVPHFEAFFSAVVRSIGLSASGQAVGHQKRLEIFVTVSQYMYRTHGPKLFGLHSPPRSLLRYVQGPG